MSDNEYMRKYMLDRYHRRMDQACIDLGGKCAQCGKTTDLEFDHIDRTKKLFTLGAEASGIAQAKWDAEVKKCQLLCADCHIAKSLGDWNPPRMRCTHGSITMYATHKCRCAECKQVGSRYNKESAMKRKAKKQAALT